MCVSWCVSVLFKDIRDTCTERSCSSTHGLIARYFCTSKASTFVPGWVTHAVSDWQLRKETHCRYFFVPVKQVLLYQYG